LTFHDEDLENIFYLNYSSIKNSYEKVYSSIIEPINGEKELSKYLSSNYETIVKIYTQSKRVICEGSVVNDSNFIISLKLDDLQQVQLIKDGEQIKLVEIIDNGESIRGMRDCKVSLIDYVKGLVTIESNLKFGI
jgi:hypothetical protein